MSTRIKPLVACVFVGSVVVNCKPVEPGTSGLKDTPATASAFAGTRAGSVERLRLTAQYANIAYNRDQGAAIAEFQRLGFTHVVPVTDQASGSQAYVLSDSRSIVVPFRGTENGRNVLTDLNGVLAVRPQYFSDGRLATNLVGIGGVESSWHPGFVESSNAMMPDLSRAISEAKDRIEAAQAEQGTEEPLALAFAGHSLGGAQAQIGAALAARTFLGRPEVYTFGSPGIGNADAQKSVRDYLQGHVYNIANPGDLVPQSTALSASGGSLQNALYTDRPVTLNAAGAHSMDWYEGYVNRLPGGDIAAAMQALHDQNASAAAAYQPPRTDESLTGPRSQGPSTDQYNYPEGGSEDVDDLTWDEGEVEPS